MAGVLKGKYLQFLTVYAFVYALAVLCFWLFGFYQATSVLGPGIALALLSVCLVYFILGFRFAAKRLDVKMAYTIGLGLLALPVVVVSITTGGYASWNNVAYVLLIFVSAMVGPGMPLMLIWLQALGYILVFGGFLKVPGTMLEGGIVVGACLAAGIGGWLMFRKHYGMENPEVERLRQTLKAQQLQSEAVIAAINDGIVIIDKKGVAVHANQKFLDMIALKPDELVGRHYNDIISTRIRIVGSSTATPRIKQNLIHVLRTGESVTVDSVSGEYLDGSGIIDFSYSLSPLKNENGDINAVMLIARNITHLMKLQRMKDSFVMTASHELRTPITVIGGYADLLLGTGSDSLNEKQRHYIERTKETAGRLTAIINDMLDISRLESGQRENNPQPIEVMPLLESMMEHQLSLFARKQLSLHLDAKPATVYADKSRLKQVIKNLLSNAQKFTPEDGKVILASKIVDDKCEISVTDTGPGVPKEHLTEVFEQFSKMDETGAVPGTGMGLAIAKNIVDNWGGSIAVENMHSGGARFYFTIPLASDKNNGEQSEDKDENTDH